VVKVEVMSDFKVVTERNLRDSSHTTTDFNNVQLPGSMSGEKSREGLTFYMINGSRGCI
jgi:hypothetical protein